MFAGAMATDAAGLGPNQNPEYRKLRCRFISRAMSLRTPSVLYDRTIADRKVDLCRQRIPNTFF